MFEKRKMVRALREGDVDKALEIMDRANISPNAKTSFGGESFMMIAVKQGMLGGAKLDGDRLLAGLIDRGGDPNMKVMDKRSLLHVPGLKASTAEILLDAGADIDAKLPKNSISMSDRQGDTPLHLAIRNGKQDLVNILYARGASLTQTNGDHHAPGALDSKGMIAKASQFMSTSWESVKQATGFAPAETKTGMNSESTRGNTNVMVKDLSAGTSDISWAATAQRQEPGHKHGARSDMSM
jgi:hypothetical protein